MYAFFTGLKDEPTVEKLASIFKKSVIPLLQEYFYEDYQKIRHVKCMVSCKLHVLNADELITEGTE